MKNTIIKFIFSAILFSSVFSVLSPQTFAANEFSAGGIDTVPEGYALTAIGYGSDDTKCTIRIWTASLNPDKTRQNTATLHESNCPDGPGDDPFWNHFQSVPEGHAITGWSWGANTGGGSPGNSSFPDNECVYQEYMNLTTGEISSFYSGSAGSCANRNYNPDSLQHVISAPGGQVIVGIDFSLANDANVSWIGSTSRFLAAITCPPGQVRVSGTCTDIQGTLGVGPAGSGQSNASLSCTAPCSPEIHWRTTVGSV